MENHFNFKDKTGEKHITNEGYEIEIIEYHGREKCVVQFYDGFILRNLQYSNIKNGKVKNPYHKSKYGVGYLGEGEYIARRGCKIYITWNNMLSRCYNEKEIIKHPTYIKCSVCEEWHNFQNYAKWYEENFVEGFEVDKDILVKGNKIYSPETCCFVPSEINNLFIKQNKNRGNLPIGVNKKNKSATYQAQISKKYLGSYVTPIEAFLVSKQAKEKHIKEMADKWKNKIKKECYNALINYNVEITD